MTPEGRVKNTIKRILEATGTYYMMPVTNGYGRVGVDFHGISRGRGFVIEAKRAKKRPTKLQEQTLREVQASGGRTFVIDGTEHTDTYRDLALWLLKT